MLPGGLLCVLAAQLTASSDWQHPDPQCAKETSARALIVTTRIAILADIHANMPAFEAVIADIEQQSPDEIIIAGDLVGRGPQGSAVVERVIELGWPSVRGNHEDYLINFFHERIPSEWKQTKE